MSAQTPLDPFVMYTRVADARPSAVDVSRWSDWQLWKQSAEGATAEVMMFSQLLFSASLTDLSPPPLPMRRPPSALT